MAFSSLFLLVMVLFSFPAWEDKPEEALPFSRRILLGFVSCYVIGVYILSLGGWLADFWDVPEMARGGYLGGYLGFLCHRLSWDTASCLGILQWGPRSSYLVSVTHGVWLGLG